MMGTTHLCVLYVATAGLQGNALGSDEEEVVLLIYVIIDMSVNKVVGLQQYLVKPTVADINENVLSEQLVEESALTEELVKNAGQPLESAIRQFDMYVRSLKIDPESPLFRLVTDGQLPLRQCLHPEACSKNIELPAYYYMFHDLRKDFRGFYSAPDDAELNSVTDLVDYLRMPHDLDSQFYVKETKDMVNIVQRLVADGHTFNSPETIDDKLEPGICSKNEEVDNNCVVRARGLPWQASDQDIAKFFRGLNVAKGGVALCLSLQGRRNGEALIQFVSQEHRDLALKRHIHDDWGGVALCLSLQGRRNGEALIRFVSQEHRDLALKRHKHHINNRYIEVYKATGEDFINVAGGRNMDAQAFLTRGAQVIIRMRGLPYDCTAKQVMEFFEAGENACNVMDGEEGVLFVKKPDGRATGDAFVLFALEDDAPKALCKHRELIGTRYIELFRSTTAEVQQVLNRSMDPKTYETPLPLPIPQLSQVPLVPQHFITSGTRKDCIRLRGLPYEAQVEHILEFLGDHAKNIVFQGVHMVYNAQGQPSGEAFIQMTSENSAFQAAQQKHHRYMVFGKKQRYIEVFQCSGEDMNLVLTGGAVSPVAKALLSPGMLPTSPPPPTPAPPPVTAPVAATPSHFDPLMAAMQAQALAQIRQNQESMWLMNQIAVAQAVAAQQQQQHALALALSAKQPQTWADYIPAIPPPQIVVSSAAPSAVTTKPHMSYPGTQFLPAVTPTPYFVLNFPPRVPPPTTFAKVPPPTMANPYAQYSQLSFVPPPPTAATPATAQPIVNLKRSWEQAFPTVAASEAGGVATKRQYPAVSTTAPPTNMPPPPPASQVAYQPAQFYAGL